MTLARIIGRRSRFIIGIWLVGVGVLAIIGIGVNGKLATRPSLIDGTASQREQDIATTAFGEDEAVLVMLRGPRLEVARQGRRLARQLKGLLDASISSPWEREALHGLRQKNTSALLIDIRKRPGYKATRIISRIRSEAAGMMKPPVYVTVIGSRSLLHSFHDAATQAAALGERIAIPILLIILLIVFRSVLAATIPVLVGGSIVIAARGVLDLISGSIAIESIALGAAGMIGLALGVDYALLIVSRFREELRLHNDAERAVQATVVATSRTIIPAGCGFVLAMLVASLVISSALVSSTALAIAIVTALSATVSLFVVPAILLVLGDNLDRWSLPNRKEGKGVASQWSSGMSMRKWVVIPVVLALIAFAGYSLALKTETASIAFLPSDNGGRREQEAVQRTLGPGWTAPFEMVVKSTNGPLTTPARLRALGNFQRRIEGKSAVTTVAGVEPIRKSMLNVKSRFVAWRRGLSGLSDFAGTSGGSRSEFVNGVQRAADGADGLSFGLSRVGAGAAGITTGLNLANTGSKKLVTGVEATGTASARLAHGIHKADIGSRGIAAGIGEAATHAHAAAGNIRVLREAIQAGNKRLARLHPALRKAAGGLSTAYQVLQKMTTGRGDGEYASVSRSVQEAYKNLTGRSPGTGRQLKPSFNGASSEIGLTQRQLSLSVFLINQGVKEGHEAQKGMSKLFHGSQRLSQGLATLSKASNKFAGVTHEIAVNSHALPDGLEHLAAGTGRFAAGLSSLQNGAQVLSTSLGVGAKKLGRLRRELNPVLTEVTQTGTKSTDAATKHTSILDSGYLYLAGLSSGAPQQRRDAEFLVNLDQGGTVARILIIPKYPAFSTRTEHLAGLLSSASGSLARQIHAEVVVGGAPVVRSDINSTFRQKTPLLRLILALVTAFILMVVLRSLLVPIIAAFLNLLAVAASFGFLALLFNGSFLGGPGFVDATVVPLIVMVMFGLALDYEIFIFARMREEYTRTGSSDLAITNGLNYMAPVISGAALTMVAVFVAFSVSSFMTIRNFGVALAVAVLIDAFIVRLVIVPALMRTLGRWAWWYPGWLERTQLT